MKAVETLGKWAVIAGAVVWAGGKIAAPLRPYEGIAGTAVLLGAGAFVLGMLL